MTRLIALTFVFLLPFAIEAKSWEDVVHELIENGVTIDLKNPELSQGVLKSDEGGIVEGKEIRIQAEKITFTYEDSLKQSVVSAEGNITVHYGPYVLIGDRLEYSFATQTGILFNGRSGRPPWYFGGEKIYLQPNGNLLIDEGFLTTTETESFDWEFHAARVGLTPCHDINAKYLQVRLGSLPLVVLPSFQTNLDHFLDSPFRYRIRWGGRRGLRVSLTYQFLDWHGLHAYARFDYSFKRGPGGGIETDYHSPSNLTQIHTVNYIANDNSVENPNQKTRYRFQGTLHTQTEDDRFGMTLNYDKLSDKYMARDYSDHDLDLKTAGKTFFNVRQQFGQAFITNLTTHVRINDFQTLKQELPSIALNCHPVSLGNTGWIADGMTKVAFLNFLYSEDSLDPDNFHSVRVYFQNRLYRNLCIGPAIFTPESGYRAIYYDNTPDGSSRWLTVGVFGAHLRTSFLKCTPCFTHRIEPYLRYQYITSPSLRPNEHFIFDINDGLNDLNLLRFGTRHLIYGKDCFGGIVNRLRGDLYSYAFINTPSAPNTIPRIYSEVQWEPIDSFRQIFKFVWDTKRNYADQYNVRSQWTVNQCLALAVEYRYRSAYSWRKAQPDNFILESTLNEQTLRNSFVSDKRNILLGHIFYRIHPNAALEYTFRYGWNRNPEPITTNPIQSLPANRRNPAFTEQQLDLIIHTPSAWNIRASYRNRENEHRVAFYFSLDQLRP